MRGHKRGVLLIVTAAAGLALTAGAGGYGVAQSADVPRGGVATFQPSFWSCRNLGARVECQSGDAYPNVTLTSSRAGGITVKVHTLRDPQGGRVVRSYEKGRPVYTFTAF